mmetsp:Transcript_83650/g.167017  ORF Transcript_83650/g.167017 Transcript_83650/m.167017 type:complete len:136 (-) Transcript_83650:128-535(-)
MDSEGSDLLWVATSPYPTRRTPGRGLVSTRASPSEITRRDPSEITPRSLAPAADRSTPLTGLLGPSPPLKVWDCLPQLTNRSVPLAFAACPSRSSFRRSIAFRTHSLAWRVAVGEKEPSEAGAHVGVGLDREALE